MAANQEQVTQRELAKRTRRSFLALGLAAAAGASGWEWLRSGSDDEGLPVPFRRVLEFNKAVTEKVLFRDSHLAPTYPPPRSQTIRPNGSIGLDGVVDLRAWRLALTKLDGKKPEHSITLDEIKRLPRAEHVTEFKCVEGWSRVVHWAGVRLADFIRRYAANCLQAKYVSLATPDGAYYVAIDMPSALHPQTLLCYEMNGAPLTAEHGAPLRLVIPVKYGIKSIKRIGAIAFRNDRPHDYWAEQGYDFYAAL
jgi:DMSO/TMAO reductase YedYZ molybdopterin-dependent catalytic subunit